MEFAVTIHISIKKMENAIIYKKMTRFRTLRHFDPSFNNSKQAAFHQETSNILATCFLYQAMMNCCDSGNSNRYYCWICFRKRSPL